MSRTDVLEAAFDACLVTSDAGPLLLGGADQAIGLVGRLDATDAAG
jgi:hypothetical protein